MNIERWGWYSILVNVVLGGLHLVVAISSGSLAVAAEVVHNLVDLLTAIAVVAGLRIAARKSASFPYGMYKVENLVAAGLAVMVFISAWEIAHLALIAPPTTVEADGWMLVVLLATGAIPLVFSHFELRAGLAANSPSLIADAREYRVHVFTTGLAFLALLAQWIHYPVDRVAAVLIVLVVVKTGWDLLRDAMRVLLDASLDGPTLDAVRRAINGDPAVVGIRWMTGRNAGRFRFVEAGVELRVAEPTWSAAVVHRIEAVVRASVPHVERVLLHLERPASPLVRYAMPLADTSGTMSPHFGEAPWFAFIVVGRTDGEATETIMLANPHCSEARAKGIRVAEWLVAQKVDVVVTGEDLGGKGPAYVLHDAGIEVRRAQLSSLQDLLAGLRAAAGA